MAANAVTSPTSNNIAKNHDLPSLLKTSPLKKTVGLVAKIIEHTTLLVKAGSICGIAITPELAEPPHNTTVADGPREWNKVLPTNLASLLDAVVGYHEGFLEELKGTLTLINGKKQGDELHDVWTKLVSYQSLIEILNKLNKGLRELYESFSHNSSDFNVPYAAVSKPASTLEAVPYTRQLLEQCGTAMCECVTVSRMIQLVIKRDTEYPDETWVPDAVILLDSDLAQCIATHVTTPL